MYIIIQESLGAAHAELPVAQVQDNANEKSVPAPSGVTRRTRSALSSPNLSHVKVNAVQFHTFFSTNELSHNCRILGHFLKLTDSETFSNFGNMSKFSTEKILCDFQIFKNFWKISKKNEHFQILPSTKSPTLGISIVRTRTNLSRSSDSDSSSKIIHAKKDLIGDLDDGDGKTVDKSVKKPEASFKSKLPPLKESPRRLAKTMEIWSVDATVLRCITYNPGAQG